MFSNNNKTLFGPCYISLCSLHYIVKVKFSISIIDKTHSLELSSKSLTFLYKSLPLELNQRSEMECRGTNLECS